MMPYRILIVDDEPDIRDILKFNLEAAGYVVATAQSAEVARTFDLATFDLLLLDVMLEGVSGFKFAGEIKSSPATGNLPVIFITARDTEDDAVEGFEIGADDYIPKPFSIREVLSRVKAVLRRTRPDHDSGIVINDDSKAVTVDGQPVSLTKTEYEILFLLYSNRDKVYSRSLIISLVWPDNVIVTDRTVDVSIARLRKKLGVYGERIVSRHGFGYCFV